MKVLLINGSPHANGNTFAALSEAAKTLQQEGVETEIVSIGAKAVQGGVHAYRKGQGGRGGYSRNDRPICRPCRRGNRRRGQENAVFVPGKDRSEPFKNL